MSASTPIPRQTRQAVLTATAGQTVFGPFDFILFDADDVEVRVKSSGGDDWLLLDSGAVTVAPAAPYSDLPAVFTVTLGTPRGAGDQVWIKGVRLGSRTTNVTLSGVIRSAPLETELDRQVATQQELRRDVSALIAGGATGELIASGIANDSTAPGGTVADALGALDARTDAAETTIADHGGRIEIVEALVASYDTVATVQTTEIGATVAYLRTAGYSAAGDGGAALYKKVASEPAHEGKIQSGDGAWWELAEPVLFAGMFGAVGDGAIDDTTAISGALARGPVFLPAGTVYDTTRDWTALDGRTFGFGQIRDSAENKRAPWFSELSAAPAYTGGEDSILTAFNGDFSRAHIASEFRISGADTLGQPATGYHYSPAATPFYHYFYNASGWNEATDSNDGRTAAVHHRIKLYQAGQGDAVAFNVSGGVGGTRAGSTSFMANPAAVIINGDLVGLADGVYLNPLEFDLSDTVGATSYDIAASGPVIKLNRNNAAGAKNVFWSGFRAQSIGTVDVNNAFCAAGKFDVGLDFSAIITDANKAAAAFRADDRLYFNSSSSHSFYATELGQAYFTYSSSLSAFNFIVANSSVLQIYGDHVVSTKPLYLGGSTSGLTILQPAAVASGALTLPAATDTLVGRATADTLTNKTINASSNTLSNLATSMFAANVIDTDGTLAANSDTRLATQKAVKTYADQLVAANDAMVFKGVIDCSTNPNYPAADRGHTYRVSVAGKIGGASGVNVEVGDLLLCLTDGTAAGAQASVGANWTLSQTNLDGAVIGPASATDLAIAIFDGAAGKLIKNSGATVPASAIVGISDIQTLTGKTFDTAAAGNVLKINGTQISDKTGTGKAVLDTSPTIGGTLSVNDVAMTGTTFEAVSATSYKPQLTMWNQNADANAGYFIVQKSHGASGAGSVVAANDLLGTFLFRGADSNGTMQVGGYLTCKVTGAAAGSVTADFQVMATGKLKLSAGGADILIDAGTINLPAAAVYKINNTQVVGPRDTGWTAMTGTANEAAAYDTSTVTLAQLAGRVMALQAALTNHGLIGT